MEPTHVRQKRPSIAPGTTIKSTLAEPAVDQKRCARPLVDVKRRPAIDCQLKDAERTTCGFPRCLQGLVDRVHAGSGTDDKTLGNPTKHPNACRDRPFRRPSTGLLSYP